MAPVPITCYNTGAVPRKKCIPVSYAAFQIWDFIPLDIRINLQQKCFYWQSTGSWFVHWAQYIVSFLYNSLTHCCAWPAEGRSVLHIERSWPAIQAAPTDRPVSSSNCCYQFLRGRPGGRFQSAAGGVPVWASIDSCSACEAGVFSGRRQMCPNNEWRLSAIRDGTSGSFVLSLTTALDTLSYHLIPRIYRI